MKHMALLWRKVLVPQFQRDCHKGYLKNAAAWLQSVKYLQTGPSAVEQQSSPDVLQTRRTKVPSPENSRMMRVAIIGVPNAGKSTIINALTTYDVCPVSRRPHTTRRNQKAIYLDDNTQLVFVDTPGLVNVKEITKFSFKEDFVYGPEKSIGMSHVIAVIHDVSNAITRDKLDPRIKAVLDKFPDKKSILILNKIDTVKTKSHLLDTVKYLTCGIVAGSPLPVRTFEEKKESHKPLDQEEILTKAKRRHQEKELMAQCETEEELISLAASKFFTKDEIKKGLHKMGWSRFSDIFMVSALEGDGIELLRRYFLLNAKPHDWLFDADTLTDVEPEKLVLNIVRSKLLEHLPQEVPFNVKAKLEFWNEAEPGILSISINLLCAKERYKWVILGTGGSVINRIIRDTEKTVSGLLNKPVKLSLNPVYDRSLRK